MNRGSALGILLISLLGLACGRTSEDPQAGEPQGSGGAGAGLSGGAGQNTAGKSAAEGGRDALGTGGKGASEGGADGGGSAGLGNVQLSSVDLSGKPIYTRVQRLTNRQWENSIGDILRLRESHRFSEYNGQRVDTSGSYPLSTGVERFSDGNELMRILANSPQAHTCYSKRLTGYALGREMAEDDRPLLEELGEVSRSRPLKELIVALVRSPTFRMRKEGLP